MKRIIARDGIFEKSVCDVCRRIARPLNDGMNSYSSS